MPQGSNIRQVSGGKAYTRAMFQPATLNEETRTIEVIVSTENPVRTYDWWTGSMFNEVLSLEAGHFRTERLDGGLPLLDNHKRTGALGVYGVVESWRVEDGKLIASVRFDDDEDSEKYYRKVKNGIVRGISVGYNVDVYEETPSGDNQIPTMRAIDWTPLEVSLAPIQADTQSVVRSEGGEGTEGVEGLGGLGNSNHTIQIITRNVAEKSQLMKREQIIALLQKRGIAFEDSATDQQLLEALERAMTPPAPTPAPEGSTPVPSAEDATRAERQRTKDIIAAVRAAGLETSFADQMIENGNTVDKARELIIAELAKADPNSGSRNTTTGTVGADQRDKVVAAVREALEHKVGLVTEFKNGGRDFRGYTLFEMGRELLHRSGVRTEGMSRREVAAASLGLGVDGMRAYHSTSDFPIILGNTINRTLRAAYDEQAPTFLPFVRRDDAVDFRERTKVQLSGLVGNFDEIVEGGEYKAGTMTEAKESYKVAKYGRKIGITWESLINDDLSAFTRIPAAIAAQARQKQSDIVYGILNGNPLMNDGVALFASAHGNLAATASVLDAANLSIARTSMRKQTGLEGNFINVQAQYLIVGPELETSAQQLINATIVATKVSDTNVFRGSLEIIVDPRITDKRWYLSASPNQVDTIEIAFLDGEELYTEERVGWDVDGLEVKARMVFGAKAIDHRGLFKNAGV